MSRSTDILIQRVQAIMPDLKIEQLERDQEGLINDVLIINNQYVFRFAKTAKYARLLEVEMKILDIIRPQIGLSVPTPIYQSSDCVVYLLLGGQPLSLKLLSGFDERTKNNIAEQLGTFLNGLHTIEISKIDGELPATRAPVKRQNWIDIRQKVRDNLYPLLQKYQIQWAEDLFDSVLENPESSEYIPALIHGDLASYHILFDDQTCKISGVIDFGMAGMGDPASDIGMLINIYGESFVNRMQKSYPDLKTYLPRARFYAQLLELEWVLRGIESGETFWFTAHLGGARDIQS